MSVEAEISLDGWDVVPPNAAAWIPSGRRGDARAQDPRSRRRLRPRAGRRRRRLMTESNRQSERGWASIESLSRVRLRPTSRLVRPGRMAPLEGVLVVLDRPNRLCEPTVEVGALSPWRFSHPLCASWLRGCVGLRRQRRSFAV